MNTERMRASLGAMAQARGINKHIGALAGPDPAVIIGTIVIVMEPACYQVFKYVGGLLDAVGEPHETFNSAATFALDTFAEAA